MDNVATTPKSNEEQEPQKGESTTPGQEGAITPKEPEGKPTTPKEPAGEPTPPENKEVVELKGKVEDLTKKLEDTQKLQSQADRKRREEKILREKIEEKLRKYRSGEVSLDDEIPENETSTEKETRLEAKIGIQNLILDNPKYQEVLKKDITLKEVIKNNPFALIGEYLDTEDAVEQIREKLDERVTSLAQPKEEPKKGEGKQFEVGPTQPGETPPSPPKQPEGQTSGDIVEESIKNRIRIT